MISILPFQINAVRINEMIKNLMKPMSALEYTSSAKIEIAEIIVIPINLMMISREWFLGFSNTGPQ
jgi:hypothetical protein